MAEASRDQNRIPTLLGVSSVDGSTPVTLYADPVTHRLYVDLAAGGTVTVDVGTTTTLASGLSATVANTGTTEDAVFAFGVPKGSTVYSTILIPDNAVGMNGDWAFSTAITAEVFYKTAGAWALVNAIRGATGATGATGPTGPVGMTWKGTYGAGTPYVIDDAVAYLGTSYICIQNGTGQTPDPAGTAYWSVLALKGTDGAGSGDVNGPATNTDSYIPQWNGANSKTLKDGLAVPAGGLAGLTEVGTKMNKFTVTALKTSNYTANVDEYVPCDISSSSFTITLPTTPADKTQIEILIVKTAVDEVLTIQAGGTDKFNRTDGPQTIYMYLAIESLVCTYQSSTGIWFLQSTAAPFNFATGFSGIDAMTPITNADISIDTTTRELTINTSRGYFDFFVDGGGKISRLRKNGAVNFPAFTDTSGTWYFYFNSTGTAVTTQTPWGTDDFATVAPIYRLVWNATFYSYTVTAANATIGATYTNNGNTYTVLGTIAGGTTLKMSSSDGEPEANGTLTKASGTGDATITFSAFSSADKLVAQYVEYHLNTISADDHKWKHLYGAIWENGFTMANNALTSGTPNADGRNTVIALSTGHNIDDNLDYIVTNDATPTDAWQQDLGDTTPATLNSTNSGQFKIFYQDAGALLSFLPATRFPFPWATATNRMEYITSVGVRTLVASGDYGVYFVYATQNPVAGEAIKVVSAPASYGNITNARAINWVDIQNTYSILADGEIRPLYRLIFLANTAWDDATKNARLYETQDLRKAVVTNTSTASGSIPASSVTVVPAGTISATNTQSALEELDSEKLGVTRVAVSTAVMAEQAVGFTLTGGTTAKVLTVALDASVSGTNTGDNAANSSSTYIGTTSVALNRASAALTLAGITLTTPDIGTPSAGVLTNTSGYANDLNLPKGKQINLTLPDTDATCTGNVTSSFNAGYSSAIGDLVFYGSAGKWLEADADAVATCNGLMGIALEAKTDGQAMKVALPNSMVHLDAWTWTTGDTLYAGETLGAMQNAIPTGANAIIKVVGFAIDADTVYFNPSSDQQSTVA